MGDKGGLRSWWKMRRAVAAGRRADAAESEPVVVAILHSEAEARLAAGLLQNEGIPARVTLDQPEGFSGGLTEAARVHVPRRNRAEAEALLAEVNGSEPG
jgi:hypothetical protein